jgi:RimJ/RimL family protein N-acetyltransferase
MASRPTLTTERLVLRPFELSDGPEVRRLAGDPGIAEMTLNVPHPYEDGMAEAWIRRHQEWFEEGVDTEFAITRRDSGELIGAVGLRGGGGPHRRAELGFWVGTPFWGRGCATEAAAAVTGYGFSGVGLNRVFAHHLRRDPASGRVLRKIGMRHEGTLFGHVCKQGRFEDIELYGVLAAEWPPDRRNQQGV